MFLQVYLRHISDLSPCLAISLTPSRVNGTIVFLHRGCQPWRHTYSSHGLFLVVIIAALKEQILLQVLCYSWDISEVVKIITVYGRNNNIFWNLSIKPSGTSPFHPH
jgi:hypothetical protein